MNVATTASNSAIMRAKIRLTCGGHYRSFEAFWDKPDMPAVAPAFLVLLNQITRASVPLMAAARDVCAARRGEGPLFPVLEAYYAKHVPEEQDHDVWILDDLEAAGFDRAAVLARTPGPEVAAMVGAQYYWLYHHHPVMLLGYIAVLEGSPPGDAHLDWLEENAGLGVAAWRTYRYHGAVDPTHLQELDEAVDAMPLTRHELGLIGVSAINTAAALARCIEALAPGDAPPRRAPADG